MDSKEELLLRKKRLLERIEWLEKELNVEKDMEDTWGGHDGSDFMDLENELRVVVEMLKFVESRLKKYK